MRVLTRDPDSSNAKQLAALNGVSLTLGAPEDDEAVRKLFKGADYAFMNSNSWALGIKNELYHGIRIFELSVQCGIKHYIWSSLDNYFHQTLYDDSLRVGHYYGKGHVEQWMYAVPQSPMRWSIITTSPYIEQLWGIQLPVKLAEGVYEFRLPLADGAIPYTCVEEMGPYVRWIFDHPDRSSGLNVKLAVEHVSLPQLASTFTAVTGKPAKATNISIDDWLEAVSHGEGSDHKIGSSTVSADDPSLLTVRQNFSAWWRLYQRSGGNKGLLRRDYAFLDEIYPQRTRSLKQWMERVGYDGDTRRKVTVSSPWSL